MVGWLRRLGYEYANPPYPWRVEEQRRGVLREVMRNALKLTPDAERASRFLRHFMAWAEARYAGKGTNSGGANC